MTALGPAAILASTTVKSAPHRRPLLRRGDQRGLGRHRRVRRAGAASTKAPSAPDSLDQRLSTDSTTPVVPGGVISQQSIVLRAVVSDPDLGDTLQLQAEVVPRRDNFTMCANGPRREGAERIASLLLWTGLTTTRATTGGCARWTRPVVSRPGGVHHRPGVQRPGRARSDVRECEAVSGRRFDGNLGGRRRQSPTVVFKAQLNDVDAGDQLVLQVEAEPVGTRSTAPSPAKCTGDNRSDGDGLDPQLDDRGGLPLADACRRQHGPGVARLGRRSAAMPSRRRTSTSRGRRRRSTGWCSPGTPSRVVQSLDRPRWRFRTRAASRSRRSTARLRSRSPPDRYRVVK